jgi:DNA-binding SARP family transcriptional activator
VFIEDLGRTKLLVGSRVVEITSLRRKVASLVVYLMTRPGFTATREQALEALWPDSTPGVGTNSLHQTIYFLRRDLEPGYSDELSPGYVRLEGELVWLDPELVDSASRRFTSVSGSRDLDAIVAAIRQYRGHFAPEFEYEEWAIATRDALHAAYLQLVDRALKGFVARGAWSEAAEIARLALAVDPAADEVEKSLIAVYERSGAHAAAAEQYAHFAASQREELGVEPPPLHEIAITPDRT